jgi:predicted Fe-S protein YdhL (DUF1289 family)
VVPEGLEYCIGCGRTLNEIAAWMQLTDSERLQVKHQAHDRLRTHEANNPQVNSPPQ